MKTEDFLQKIKGELIVSCQALEDEPLHGADYMARMGLAAKSGGAAAIRANGAEDIAAIKKVINLPVIGLVKRDYPDSPIYITPTKKEVDELIKVETDVIALDATNRKRPDDQTLAELIQYIKNHSDCLVMADISTIDEAVQAEQLGVDLIGTTLSGYTPYTQDRSKPDLALIKEMKTKVDLPIIGEGNIQTPTDAVEALNAGAFSVVVGTAITRPQIITKKFVSAIQDTTK